MESKTAYYSDTGSIDDLTAFVAKNQELLLVPEHGMEGGRTLLHIAASYGSIKVCEELIGLGISINTSAVSAGGKLPIGEAAARGHLDLVSWLIEHGSLVDGPPEAITTPLMDSSINGHPSVVALLLQQDADVNRLHLKYNQTSLDLALIYKQDEVADLLKNAGGQKAIEPIDFSSEGAGILEHIEGRVGSVLSVRPIREFYSRRVEYLTALIRGEKNCKIFFLFGIHRLVPRFEFIFCLQYDWPLNDSAFIRKTDVSFPIQVLSELTKSRWNGDLISEGNIFDKDTFSIGEICWPDGVDAIIAIDYQFDNVERKKQADEDVTLLALVPIKYTKSGRPVGKKLEEIISKLRTSSWKKISLRRSFS
jgi:ankyrin repeat protein